jgi:hypothetical protein
MNNNQMGMPPVAPAPRKNNTTLIIVIAVLVLCCCCVAIALPLAWSCGDMLMGVPGASCSSLF